MNTIKLNLNEITEEQLMAAIDENRQIVSRMSNEVAKLRQTAACTQRTPVIDKSKGDVAPYDEMPTTTKEGQASRDEVFENAVEGYYLQIKNLSPDQLQEKANELLPGHDDYQFESIINRLSLEVIRSIKELKDYIKTEELSSEERTMLEEEMLAEEEKLRILRAYSTPTTKEQLPENEDLREENNLIFVPTPGGNIRVLDELERIPSEYYARFYELFRSIKTGTFKSNQRLVSLPGLSLVRAFNIRLAYTRLNKNTYAVLTAYIKKAETDKAADTSLIAKYNDYKAIEDKLITNLSNPEFMALNQQCEAELFRKLAKGKETPVVKRKDVQNG